MARIRFFRNRQGQRIAYVDEGRGPLVVLPAWWISHLERDAEDPGYRRFFERLSSRLRVVRYDRVGVGLSDRGRRSFTLQSEVEDVDALIDHLRAPRLHLLGCSCAGPVAMAWAAANVERVDRLVLYGTYLRGEKLAPPDLRAAMVALVRAHGRTGLRALADVFHPNADVETRRGFDRLMRDSAEPETAARLLELTHALDASPLAKRVKAPVLVLHRKEDRAVRYAEGRALAAALPNAELCTLSGAAHLPWHEDADSVADAVVGFLAPAPARGDSRATTDAGAAELKRDGEVWRLRFAGRQALLRDSKGLGDLARLLGRPGQDIHVLDLIGAEPSERRDAGRADSVLDGRALQSCRKRLGEIDEALAEAESHADIGRRSQLVEEREQLLRWLAAGTGRGGRARRLNDPVERARKAVTARLRDAIRRVKTSHRSAGDHLEHAIETGVCCVYRPSPPVVWTVSPDRT